MALKILLADDSMIAQNMGKKILTDAGYDVIGVSNGAAAVKKLAEGVPDIVLLDVYMPGYSGLEVCERIKNTPTTAHVPVLLTVGKLEPFRAEEGIKVRADGVIVKPFEATDLITVVAKLAERVGGKEVTRPAQAAPSPAAEPVKVEPAGQPVKVEPAQVEPNESRTAKVEVPAHVAAVPAFMTEALGVPTPSMAKPSPAKPAAPSAAQVAASVSTLTKPAGSTLPAFDVNEAAKSYAPPAVIPIVAVERGQMAIAERVQTLDATDPEVEFNVAPKSENVAIPTVPDLEPTILQDPVEVAITPDPSLIGNALDTETPAQAEEALPEFHIETGVEEPELAVLDNQAAAQAEEAEAQSQLEAAVDAGDGGSMTPAYAGAAPVQDSAFDGLVTEIPARPLEIRLEPASSPALPHAPAAQGETAAARSSGAAHTAEPIPPNPTAPLGQTSLDDHIDRALHAVLASVNREPDMPAAHEVPRSLDDIDEELDSVLQPAVTDIEGGPEPAAELVVPPKEERVEVSFGPEIGDAKEIVDTPAAIAPFVASAPNLSPSRPAAMPPPEPVSAAPVAAPITPSHRPVTSQPVPAAPQESAAVAKPQPPKETVPETPVSGSKTEAVRAVENALAAVNETIAEQVVDRVLQRVRRELIEDLKRLLKET